MKVDNFVSNRLQNYISKFLLQLGPPKRSILATPLVVEVVVKVVDVDVDVTLIT